MNCVSLADCVCASVCLHLVCVCQAQRFSMDEDEAIEENIPETSFSPKSSLGSPKYGGDDNIPDEVEEDEALSAEQLIHISSPDKATQQQLANSAVEEEEIPSTSNGAAEPTTPVRPTNTAEEEEAEAPPKTELSPHALSVQELIRTTQSLIGDLSIHAPTPPQMNAWKKQQKAAAGYRTSSSSKTSSAGGKSRSPTMRAAYNPSLANQLVETVMGGAGASSSVALGRAGTKAELGKIDSVAQNSKATMSAARDMMADRSRDRQLKKEHDKLVARLLEAKQKQKDDEEKEEKEVAKKKRIEKEVAARAVKVRQWQEERSSAVQAQVKQKEDQQRKKEESRKKLKEARKARKRRARRDRAQERPSDDERAQPDRKPSAAVTLGSEPGSENYALDSLIAQYISISSSLRAQLHITELRLASRARLAKRGREIEEELVGGAKSPTKSEKAHTKVMRVRKLLTEVDEELPTLHYLLADVEFLARPNRRAEPTTPPAVTRSREVLQSIQQQQSGAGSYESYINGGPNGGSTDDAAAENGRAAMPRAKKKKKRAKKLVPTSPGAESSAFLDFNDAVERSKGGFATSTPFSPPPRNKARKVPGSVSPINKNARGKSKSARLRSHRKRAEDAYGAGGGGARPVSKKPAITKSLSVADIREIKRRRAMGGRLAFQKETASSASRRDGEKRERKKKRKKKKAVKAATESRADERDEIDETAGSRQQKKSADDFSSLYANHPSITFIP